MAYEPKTEEGKAALVAGADPIVVEEMENEGEIAPNEEKKTPEGDAGKKPNEEKPQEDKKPEGEEGDQPINRTPQHMPVWKHKEELKKREEELRGQFKTELETAVAEAASKNGGASDEDVAKIAEEFNLEPQIAGALVDRMASVIEKKLGLSEIKKSTEALEEQNRTTAEETGFNNEFASQATQDAIKAALGENVPQGLKEKVKELAYSTTYARYRLADIVRLEKDTLAPESAKPAKTAEVSRGGSQAGGGAKKDITEMTPEEIEAMSDEEFSKYSNELGGKQSRFTKIVSPKKTR